MAKLFSYGTLQHELVQLSLFGRKLSGKPDVLAGYQMSEIQVIEGEHENVMTYPIIYYTGNKADRVEGVVYGIKIDEFFYADQYEGEEYQRKILPLQSGQVAWVYVAVADS